VSDSQINRKPNATTDPSDSIDLARKPVTGEVVGDGRVEHARRVRAMFAGIAGRYDLLNHLLSANVDKRWRRLVARELESSLGAGSRILDVACGTGDLSLALAETGEAAIVGLDFCRPMLEIARRKASDEARSIPFIEGDALRLPFADESFDAVTIAFGLRNLAGVAEGLSELRRVLKRGGRLAVLEFSSPVVPGFRAAFNFYFTRVLPRIGGLVSGSRGAYEYLPDSVSKFPDQRQLAGMMRETGFDRVEYRNLTGGIAALHTGTRRN
jgi:demethylmenaquinone methyltransferase / 2-methoxy-6-polyprenyl-1,4-benzoquinol methylase